VLPRAQDPPGPFSLQILIKNNKECAPESSGSSRSIFLTIPYITLGTNYKGIM
jgi:hypothetical protein